MLILPTLTRIAFLFGAFANLSLVLAAAAHQPTFDEFNADGTIKTVVVARPARSNERLEERNRFRAEACLKNEHLTMVPLTPQHVAAFTKDLFEVPEVMTWYEVGKVRTKAEHGKSAADYVAGRTQAWIERWETSPFSWWALFAGDQFVGGFGAFLETGGANKDQIQLAYLINNKFWRQHHAANALNLFLEYAVAKSQAFTCFFAPVHPNNQPSRAFLARMGFVHDPAQDKLKEAVDFNKRITMVLPRNYKELLAKEVLISIFAAKPDIMALIFLYF